MSDRNTGYRSKVNRLISEYELRGLGDELEHRWTREENRDSLRALGDYFNKRLLAAAIEGSELGPLYSDIDNIYRILTDDAVSSGIRQETRSRLKHDGVDVDGLEEDFVTYQAIRTYLENYRGVKAPNGSTDTSSRLYTKRNTIQKLVSRLNTVTSEAIAELDTAGPLSIGDFEVIVNVDVHCEDCQSRLSVSELLREGGCHCT